MIVKKVSLGKLIENKVPKTRSTQEICEDLIKNIRVNKIRREKIKSIFNIFEHKSGSANALQGHKHNYNNLFEWDLTINYEIKPGQGVMFRPWLFHSFDTGLIQTFRITEK